MSKYEYSSLSLFAHRFATAVWLLLLLCFVVEWNERKKKSFSCVDVNTEWWREIPVESLGDWICEYVVRTNSSLIPCDVKVNEGILSIQRWIGRPRPSDPMLLFLVFLSIQLNTVYLNIYKKKG